MSAAAGTAAPAGARGVVLVLGTAQTLAWASSYYLPAILAAPMAAEFGVPASWVFGAFSAALVLSALLGPWAGRTIDRRGGRPVLFASSGLFVAALLLLAWAPTFPLLVAGWLLLGVGMAVGLYDSAFAALAGLYGREARGPITGVTLLAGFASTVGWPLSALMAEAFGWRGALLGWAGLHLLLGLPLNLWLPRGGAGAVATAAPADGAASEAAPPRSAALLLGFVFATTWFVTGAMAAHLPGVLAAAGLSAAVAVAAGALIGPAQVAARVAEWGLLRRMHPVVSARLAAFGHPLGVAALFLLAGPAGAYALALLHGAGNGILTIAKGTLPLAVFGPAGYGARQGWLGAPARLLQASSPFLFGIALERLGAGALGITTGLSLAAFVALLLLRVVPR